MNKYLQMEYFAPAGANPETAAGLILGPNDPIAFDRVISSSSYESISAVHDGTADFYYDASALDGIITFNKPGLYYINWWVAQKTGLSTDGKWFGLYLKQPVKPEDWDDGRDGTFDPDYQYVWQDNRYEAGDAVAFVAYSDSKSHLKIDSSAGFALLSVGTQETGTQLKIINTSNRPATLSHFPGAKAAIAIFNVGCDDQGDEIHMDALHVQVQSPGTDTTFAKSGNDVTYGWGQEISGNALIPFDTALEAITDHLLLTDVGEITIEEAGYYHVTWEIPYNATDLADFVHFALYLDETKKVDGINPMPIGSITGTAILRVEANQVLTLRNALPEDTVRIMQYSNLTITRIPDVSWYGTKLPFRSSQLPNFLQQP